METLQEDPPLTRRARRESEAAPVKPPKKRRRVSVFGVIGEILITIGLAVLLYVAWQMWIGDVIYAAQKNATGSALTEQWAQDYADTAPEPAPVPADPADLVTADPVILPQPADAEVFGVMRIPRFGDDYQVEIAGGVSRARTLDPIGIGHYPDSAMPGEVGNFAVAAHRTTFGKPFNQIADLQVGDAIVVETADGWYTYRFRTLEYVTPSAVDVLLDVPQKPDVPAGERYITMTSCSPMFAMTERIVGYGLFESFTPRDAGAPSSLAAVA